ncbi:MAG TPA: hypothetical protein VGH66_16510 [Acidimicrobiales bacterium]
MPTSSKKASTVTIEAKTERADSPSVSVRRVPNPFTVLEPILQRDEADWLFVAGNLALVAFEVIEWPVAVLALVLHGMSRSRVKALQVIVEVAEEAE